MISMIYVGGVQYHDFMHTPVFLNQIFTLNPKIITIFSHFHYWLGSGMILILSIISIIQHNSSIISVLLKLFKCCKRQPTIIFVVLCDYKLVRSNVTSRWIFEFFEIFCQLQRISIFRGFIFRLKKVRFKTFSLMGRL